MSFILELPRFTIPLTKLIQHLLLAIYIIKLLCKYVVLVTKNGIFCYRNTGYEELQGETADTQISEESEDAANADPDQVL